MINIAGVTSGNELIAENSILNSLHFQQRERERERENRKKKKKKTGRGAVRGALPIIWGGGESEKFAAVKVPRKCPLVLLAKLCW